MDEFTSQLLEREAMARRDLTPAEYDALLCNLFDATTAARTDDERLQALIALASAALRYADPTLVVLRSCCAEHLLSAHSNAVPEMRRYIELLFLLAWLQLGAIVERGPTVILGSPPLPNGVALPSGADLELIIDPDLRRQARELQNRHRAEVDRWKAKQAALDKMTFLATLVRLLRGDSEDDAEAKKVLAAAMTLVPALPEVLRQQLADLSR